VVGHVHTYNSNLDLTDNKQAYRLSLLLMYIAADICESAAVDVESWLKANGGYRFQDKQTVKAIKFNAGRMVKSVDTICSPEFAEKFGDIADEAREMLGGFLKDKL
jgi:hypothetical protein